MSQTITRRDLETPVPVQGVVRLLEVQENLVENCLPHGRYMLEHIVLEVRSPCPASRLEPMNHIMEPDCRCEKFVEEDHYGVI